MKTSTGFSTKCKAINSSQEKISVHSYISYISKILAKYTAPLPLLRNSFTVAFLSLFLFTVFWVVGDKSPAHAQNQNNIATKGTPTPVIAAAATTAPSFSTNGLGSDNGQQLHVAASLELEDTETTPGTETSLAIHMKPQPGWHGYWENPGDAGFATEFRWDLPPGLSIGEPSYPTPYPFIVANIVNYVYKAEFTLLLPVKVDTSVKPGRYNISAEGRWLACTDEICVPQFDTLSTTIEIKDDIGFQNIGGTINEESRGQRFDDYRAKLPITLTNDQFTAEKKPIYTKMDDGRIIFSLPLANGAKIDDPYLFPRDDGVVDYSAVQTFYTHDDIILIETQAHPSSAAILSANDDIRAVFRKEKGVGLEVRFQKGEILNLPNAERVGQYDPANLSPVDNLQENNITENGFPFSTLIYAVIGALAGGLLLNLMPCVFPILSLKALSIAQMGHNQKAARAQSWSYAAGIIVTSSVLGIILLILRASGEAVGWAFQLQNPAILFVLLVICAGIAFNLAGLFDLPGVGFTSTEPQSSTSSQSKENPGRSSAFMTGVLAAIVATPCTGPFMGAALGATIVLPPLAALLIFAALGIGLALPFLIIAYSPTFAKMLPKPGPWMETFRKLLSLPMFITAIAIIWLLAPQVGTNGLALILLTLMAIMLPLWWYGEGQRNNLLMGRSGQTETLRLSQGAISASLVASMVIAGAWFTHSLSTGNAVAGPNMAGNIPASRASASNIAVTEEIFSVTRLDTLRKEGKPVFLYFTADWCITCKVNEASVINRDIVSQYFADQGIVKMVGDWTRPDPEITKVLTQHGRAGVPLYLYYSPDGELQTLPQILTIDMVTSLASK